MERKQRIHHRQHRDAREQHGADLAGAITKVQQANGQGAEDDGEVEPGEEGTFVGEEDFGFDARGDCDAFA